MTEAADKQTDASASALSRTIREVKNASADREDVVVDIREAQRTRLEVLADELKPVFDEVPRDDARFDLAISSGLQPRLWIDAVAHVTMGRDRRTYRVLLDTRLGRTVLIETADVKAAAASVTRYIAERMVERQRMLEGEPISMLVSETPQTDREQARPSRVGLVMRGVGIMLLGALVGGGIVLALAWQRIAELGLGFG